MLSLGKLCDELGCSYLWQPGANSQLTNGKKNATSITSSLAVAKESATPSSDAIPSGYNRASEKPCAPKEMEKTMFKLLEATLSSVVTDAGWRPLRLSQKGKRDWDKETHQFQTKGGDHNVFTFPEGSEFRCLRDGQGHARKMPNQTSGTPSSCKDGFSYWKKSYSTKTRDAAEAASWSQSESLE